jgi:diguanylate cyclase (GGDEF)-like protein/PAS domain S-box-containing protein
MHPASVDDPAERSAVVLAIVLDCLPSGISVFGADLEMLACNQKFKDLLDYPEELFAKGLPSLPTLFHFNAARGEYGPGDAARIAAEHIERAKKMQAHVYERVRPNGTTLEIRGTPLPGGGFVAIHTDVTERTRAQSATERAKSLMEQAIDHSSTYIWETDSNGRLTFVYGSKKAIGFKSDEMLGRRVTDLRALGMEEDASPDNALTEAIKARLPYENLPLRYVGDNGRQVWVSSSGYPFADSDGRFRGYRGANVNLTDLIIAKKELEELVVRDPLTGLANRRLLIEQFQREAIRQRRSGKPLSLLLLDLDHFKSVNDRYGHLAGDTCLKRISTAIESRLRRADIVARFGGEEFIVLLPDTDEAGAIIAAENLCKTVAATEIVLPEAVVRLTVSIGVATAKPGATWDFDLLMGIADKAMYVAKKLGRNRVCTSADQA